MSWTAVAIAGSAVIGGIATTSAANTAAGASEEAMAAQLQGIRNQAVEDRTTLRIIREGLQEALDKGLIDLDTANEAAQAALEGGYEAAKEVLGPAFQGAISQLEPFVGLEEYNLAKRFLADPSLAFDLPGVQFQFEQGEKALENILSKSTGGAISGDIIKAAQEYGQNFASTKLDEALNRLFPFINMSERARTNIANLGVDEAKTIGNLEIGKGTDIANLASTLGINKANLRSTAAGGEAAAAQSLAPKTGIATGNVLGQNAINQGNIRTNLINQLSKIEKSTIEQLIETGAFGGSPGRESTFSNLLSTGGGQNQFVNPRTGLSNITNFQFDETLRP